MFGRVLLCCWCFSLLRLSSSLVHGGVRLGNSPVAGIQTDTSYLTDIDRSHAPNPLQDAVLLSVDSEEDQFLMESAPNNEDSSAPQLQGRAVRSPRRCIPHQQFCLGYSLPCCDPCDTCYCRFYNAICYCRQVGHTCPHRRN